MHVTVQLPDSRGHDVVSQAFPAEYGPCSYASQLCVLIVDIIRARHHRELHLKSLHSPEATFWLARHSHEPLTQLWKS